MGGWAILELRNSKASGGERPDRFAWLGEGSDMPGA